MVFAILSVIELIYDNSIKGSFFKKIKSRGWLLVIIALLSVVFNLYKDWRADIKQAMADNAKMKSDSLLRTKQIEILLLQNSTKETIIKKVDSSYVKSIRASNDALAKYNLKITDSLHSVVSKLKLDAAKPQILLAPLEKGKRPAFLTKDNDQNRFNIQFISKGGTSYNISLHCYLLKEIANDNYIILGSSPLTTGDSFLTEDVTRTKYLEITPNIFAYTEVIVFITGYFSKDYEGSIRIPYNEAFKFNFKENIYLFGWAMNYEKLKKKLSIE
ncbi:MAG: hypothetical protein M0P61_03850 [Ignavibacteriaceae bacterium]|nr:hypothetical protein [Ignavibacteriaceae bacterium]